MWHLWGPLFWLPSHLPQSPTQWGGVRRPNSVARGLGFLLSPSGLACKTSRGASMLPPRSAEGTKEARARMWGPWDSGWQAQSCLHWGICTLDLAEWKINLCVKPLKFGSLLLVSITYPGISPNWLLFWMRVRKRNEWFSLSGGGKAGGL